MNSILDNNILSPGSFAGVTVAGAKNERLPLPIVFIKQFDAIKKMAAERKDNGAKLDLERVMFKVLLDVLAMVTIKQMHKKLLRSIEIVGQLVEVGQNDLHYQAAVRNINDQRRKKRRKKR